MEYFIYGATLEGLLVGSYLHQRGHSVTVFEPSAKIGGCFSPVEFRSTLVKSVLSTLPYDEKTWEQIQNLAQKLGLAADFKKESLAPQTFEKGHFEPFVGFGENAPASAELLHDFTGQDRIEILPSIESWIQTIAQSGLQIRYQTAITAIETENNRIISATINDKENIRAENFIFATPIKDLLGVLNAQLIPAKVLSKISKAEFWSTVQLSLVHNKPISDRKEIHFLYGTQKNPIVCIGLFGETTSQWISLLPTDSFDINEEGAQVLKEMKRQIKRAYPEAFDNVVFEKIALLPETHGHIDVKSKNLEIPLENINICSAQLVASNNPLSASLSAVERFSINEAPHAP